jgi:DNA-binding transcriptional regulator GbsR (MarR family)
VELAQLRIAQRCRQLGERLARVTGADQDIVAARPERRGGMAADEAGAAGNEDFHCAVLSVISVLTEVSDSTILLSSHLLPAAMATDPGITERFVLHWGEMAARWGVNRTVAQIHALLYLSGKPLNAEDIAAALQVARSNVSTSLRELQNWDLVKVVHILGDRRDHYETFQDPWDLLRVLVKEKKEREFDPTLAFLQDCVAGPAFAREDPGMQKRLREMLALMEALSTWSEQVLGMENSVLRKLVKLGAKMQRCSRRPEAARICHRFCRIAEHTDAMKTNNKFCVPLTVYYDKSCPMCATEMAVIDGMNWRGRLQLVDCSAADFDGSAAAKEGSRARR